MESNLCICGNSLEECNTVKLYQKGCETINQASEKRRDSIEVKEGDKVNKECRRTYTNEYSMILNKKVT